MRVKFLTVKHAKLTLIGDISATVFSTFCFVLIFFSFFFSFLFFLHCGVKQFFPTILRIDKIYWALSDLKSSQICQWTLFVVLNKKQSSTVGKIRHLAQSRILLFSGRLFITFTARAWLLGERKGSWKQLACVFMKSKKKYGVKLAQNMIFIHQF